MCWKLLATKYQKGRRCHNISRNVMFDAQKDLNSYLLSMELSRLDKTDSVQCRENSLLPFMCNTVLQIVGVCTEELQAAQQWNGQGILELMRGVRVWVQECVSTWPVQAGERKPVSGFNVLFQHVTKNRRKRKDIKTKLNYKSKKGAGRS